MAVVATQGILMPGYPSIIVPPNFSSATIDATGEKLAFVGRCWWAGSDASKDITRVGFRFGTIVKAGGSALTVSLQNVDTTSGPSFRPDGTQDQTVAIANANASFVTDTWIRTGALNASRTVTRGELLSVVLEFDGGGRLGADSVQWTFLQGLGSQGNNGASGPVEFAASWNADVGQNCLVLEFTDGSFGSLDASLPADTIVSSAFNSGTTIGSGGDERALEFAVPFPCQIDGVWVTVAAAASADFDIVLYNGSTAMETISIDQNTVGSASARFYGVPTSTRHSLTPGTTYRLAVKPTTANSVTIYSFTVSDANHFQSIWGGTSWTYAFRADAGAWTTTNTQRPWAGIRISGLEHGVNPTYAAGIV